MKKKINIVISLFLMFTMFGCSSKKESENVKPIETETIETEETIEEQEELPILFDGDSDVNAVLVSYNNVNHDNEIVYGDFEIYHHHGSNHADQARDFDFNGFEIVVTSNPNYMKVYIGYTKIDKTNDEYKDETFKWIKALYPNASDDDVESAWKEMEESNIHDVTIKNETFKELNINVTENNGKIQYLQVIRHD